MEAVGASHLSRDKARGKIMLADIDARLAKCACTSVAERVVGRCI